MHWSVERQLLTLIGLAYLAGSIPFGLIVGLARGIDVRKQGSGNIGASNVGRLLGKKFFFFVMFLDLLKGLIPMLAASWVVRGTPPTQTIYILWLSVGFAAVFGHMFSLFLKFKGGKGVATSAGILLGLWPFYTLPGFVTIGTFIVLFFATRYISVGSIGAAIMFPIAYLIIGWRCGWDPLGSQWPLLAFAIVISGLVIWKHRSNIARLRAGTEHRMVPSATQSDANRL
jgi:glycerol-3-phosphate acyltransferase PlsY